MYLPLTTVLRYAIGRRVKEISYSQYLDSDDVHEVVEPEDILVR